MKFTPNGADGSFKIGVLSCRVISPPAPIETIWLVEKGGANGVTEAPDAGAPIGEGGRKTGAGIVGNNGIGELRVNGLGDDESTGQRQRQTDIFHTLIFQCFRELSGRVVIERPARSQKDFVQMAVRTTA